MIRILGARARCYSIARESLWHGNRKMPAVFFHCSDDKHVILDRTGVAMDLAEAWVHAEQLARSFVMTPSAEDWRNWAVHVTDDIGTEIFELPFTAVLGELH